jgi:hypothetical protein
MTATAELVVPRSIPMTAPLTFSSAYPRLNVELRGDLMVGWARRTDEVARGRKVRDILEENMAVDVGGVSLQRDASNEKVEDG